ncbi:MAG TPA: polysaccharide deacetylase family protein [Flavisolibacter sp.]|nr:polysaccharide deacetylase family protein [Flavisolibacter sp.]
MHRFFIKTPWWAKRLFPSYIWRMPVTEKIVYLTFDDGPHPIITPWVVNELAKYDAVATFFCIGANVVKHPDVYRLLLEAGHSVGNHTYQHLNGWKTDTGFYLNDVADAAKLISSNLFRPPYGKIKPAQATGLSGAMGNAKLKLIMWDVLSADFDISLLPRQCAMNVIKNVSPGSIIVFHDSEKAFKNLEGALPAVLKHLRGEGYAFAKITMEGP